MNNGVTKGKNLAIYSIICAAISFFVLGLPLSLFGLILSAVSLDRGYQKAVIPMIINTIFFILSLIAIIV